MKSRLFILGMLVAGIVLSTDDISLAFQGEFGTNAAISQYGPPPPIPRPTPVGVGGVPAIPRPTPESRSRPEGQVAIPRPTPPPAGVLVALESLQRPRQQAALAKSREMPLTGFAVIPVLLGGVALLAGGLILRRTGTDQRSGEV
jgi:hypothetical protein